MQINTIVDILYSLTDTQAIMEALRATLTAVSPKYPKEEQTFQEKLIQFRVMLDERKQPLLEKVIAAEEKRMASNMLYLIWKGIQQNLSCFSNPVEKAFIEQDYEYIHQEDEMNGMPDSIAADTACRILSLVLSKEERAADPITYYYSFLETVAYKLAHFYGFQFGDQFLPLVEPGYCADPALTAQYANEVSSYLKIDIQKLTDTKHSGGIRE